MDDHTRILDGLRRTWDGEPWYGPSLRALLADVDAPLAAAHPVPGAHSIWETVRHLSLWTMAVRRRLGGEPVTYADGDDWPAVTSHESSAWLATLDVLEQAHRAVESYVAAMPADALAELVPGQRITHAAMLHGLVQHDVYHAGQIALLKRAARGAPPA